MVVKKGNTVEKEIIENIKLPKWIDNLITQKWFLYLMIATLIMGGLYMSPIGASIFASTSTTQKSQPPPDNNPPPPSIKTPPTGTATPTPTPTSGQETTQPLSNEWYSISAKEYRTGEKFQYNGINFIIVVGPNGRGTSLYITSEELHKIIISEKSLLIKIKFRIKGMNEVFETPVVAFSSLMTDPMKGWTETLGDRAQNLQPSDIEWQPEFGLKNKYND